MLGQIGGSGVDVLSGGPFSAMLLAILVGGAVYLAASLAQGRASFQTESVPRGSGPARAAENPVLRTLYALALAVLFRLRGIRDRNLLPVSGVPRERCALPGGHASSGTFPSR